MLVFFYFSERGVGIVGTEKSNFNQATILESKSSNAFGSPNSGPSVYFYTKKAHSEEQAFHSL